MNRQDERWEAIVHTPIDGILGEMGYDLTGEVREILEGSGLRHGPPVLELATGTGRAIAVLTRLGHRVVTGDLTVDGLRTARARVGASYLPSVQFIRLRMEQLPFGNRTVSSLVSCTTIHELSAPVPCVSEMLRVLAPGGVLVIADFNETGFAAVEHAHRKLERGAHSRGLLPMEDVAALLRACLLSVREVRTPLLTAHIATGTRAAAGVPFL